MPNMLWTVSWRRLFWYVVLNIQADPAALISWRWNFCIQSYKEFRDHNSNYQFSKTSPTIKINLMLNDEVYVYI